MKYVLDASVSARWLLATPLSAKAMQLRSDYRNQIHELIAPETILCETANALLKTKRQKLIRPGQAGIHYYDFLSTQPGLCPAAPLVQPAMTIALQTKAGLYDCMYVVLAEREQCQLVTADQRLVNNLQAQYSFIVPLSSLP